MVDEAELHQLGRLDDAAGDLLVRMARRRVARGMIVDEDEPEPTAADHRAKDFPRMGGRLAHAADGNGVRADGPQAGIQRDDDHVLLREMRELRREGGVDALRRFQRLRLETLARHAGSELESGREFRRLGQADPMFRGKLAHGQPAEGSQRSVFPVQVAADLDGAAAFDAGRKEEREKFRIVERPGPELRHFLSRPLFIGEIVDAAGKIGVALDVHKNNLGGVAVRGKHEFAAHPAARIPP